MLDIKVVYDISKFGKRHCPSCGRLIPRSADRCPACGYSFAPPWKCPQWVGFVILGFIVWVLVWAALH